MSSLLSSPVLWVCSSFGQHQERDADVKDEDLPVNLQSKLSTLRVLKRSCMQKPAFIELTKINAASGDNINILSYSNYAFINLHQTANNVG